MNSKTGKGFTLIELLVVIAMIAMVAGALSMGFGAAQERARVQKATTEVKAISQAILAYEYYGELPNVSDADADATTLAFLIGQSGSSERTGQEIPALLMASLSSGGVMKDPWGTPYRIKIEAGGKNVELSNISQNLSTGYFYPNFYRLSKEERQ